MDRLLKNNDLRPPSVRGEYTIEKILDSRKRTGNQEYLIKWSGYPRNLATWEPEGNLQNAIDLVTAFNVGVIRDPKVVAVKEKWLNVISEHYQRKLKNFPRGFNFKWVPRRNNPNVIDYYIHVDENLVQPKGVIRSIPDLKRYLEKL